MPNKIFLETYPLYRRLEFERAYYQDEFEDIPKPAINMHCEVCKSIQTFNMINEYWENYQSAKVKIWGETVRAQYICSACRKGEYIFFLEFVKTGQSKKDEDIYTGYLRKVGQNPPWEIEIDKNLEKILGGYKNLYKNGLVNESQGYGIGAYSYYRRITEEIIDDLLEKIYSLIEGESRKEKYKEALEKVKKTRVVEEKINLVKDLLPESLRPENLNPLDILYEALSAGIHGKTDDDCLELAEDIRKVLVYLVNQVLYHQKVSTEFKDSMRKILESKSKK